MAGLTYDTIFASNASLQRCWALLVDPNYYTTKIYGEHLPVPTSSPTFSPQKCTNLPHDTNDGEDNSLYISSSSINYSSSPSQCSSPIAAISRDNLHIVNGYQEDNVDCSECNHHQRDTEVEDVDLKMASV